MRSRWLLHLSVTVATTLFAALVLCPAQAEDPPRPVRVKPRPQSTLWRKVNDQGMKYVTTSHPRALDLEVGRGARILKYRNGDYVHTIHKQYLKVCGAASLAMVLRQLGVSRPPRAHLDPSGAARRPALRLPANVDGREGAFVDVGYSGSMEHIMYLGYHRRRLDVDGNSWFDGNPDFMSREGWLNTAKSSTLKKTFDGNRLAYYPGTHVPKWMWNGAAVGFIAGDDFYTMLSGIMNYHFSGRARGPWRDAMPLMFGSGSDADVVAYRRIVKGFIDHGLSVVCGVDDRRHFNALVGYRGEVSPASAPFYVYTADPLDGWGRRPPRGQPLRWRRTELSAATTLAGSGALVGIVAWNHHASGAAARGFPPGDWAIRVDRQNGNDWLTGARRQPTASDPLRSRLAQPAERMPRGR